MELLTVIYSFRYFPARLVYLNPHNFNSVNFLRTQWLGCVKKNIIFLFNIYFTNIH